MSTFRVTANNGAESLNVTTTDVATGVYWGGRSQRVYEPEARVLFVVRESSLSAIHQLANMAATVLGGHSHRDDLHDLINGGASPLALDTLYLGELTRRKHAHRIET